MNVKGPFSSSLVRLTICLYGDPVMAISLNGKIDEWERADFYDLAGELELNRRGFAAGLDRMLGKLEAEIPAVRGISTEGNWAGQSEAMQDRLGLLSRRS